MGIEYQTSERQSLEEYNHEINEAETEIVRGGFITAEDLKKRSPLMVIWSKTAKVQLQKSF